MLPFGPEFLVLILIALLVLPFYLVKWILSTMSEDDGAPTAD